VDSVWRLCLLQLAIFLFVLTTGGR
jgi:hypothetical protein